MSVAESNGAVNAPTMSLEQVTSTIYTALNPGSAGKEASLEADRVLKSNHSLWPLILQVLASQVAVQDQVIFYCLSLLEHYSHSTCSFRSGFTRLCAEWLSEGRTVKMANFIKNKTAQIWCRLVIEEYTSGWPTVFSEMYSWWMMTAEHADLFLRICLAVNEELCKDILDDRKEDTMITRVKDKMREGDVGQLLQVWRLLITDRQQKALARMALRCIAGYAPWIDVNLTANPDLLQHVYACLESADFCSLAIECLTAIVGKGMAVSEKLKLIVYLNLNSVYLGTLRMKEENEEFFQKACRLLNISGYTLLNTFDDQVAAYLLQSLVPTLTQYLLSTDSMECLLSLAPFTCQVPEYFKGRPSILNSESILLDLFKAVIKVLTLPSHFDFDSPGEEEELFPEVRQKYMSAFDQSLAVLGGPATTVMIEKMQVSGNPNADLEHQELGVYLCFRYCDAHRGFSFVNSVGGNQKLSPFGQILTDLFNRQFSVSVPFIYSTFLDCAGRISQTPFFELFPPSYQSCLMTVVSGMQIMDLEDHELPKKIFACFNKLVKSQKNITFAHDLLNVCSPFAANLSADQPEGKWEFYEAIGYLSGLLKDMSLMAHFESSLTIHPQVIKYCAAYLKGLCESNDAKNSCLDVNRVAKYSGRLADILAKSPSVEYFEACKYFCQRTIGVIRALGQPLLLQLLIFAINSNDELLLSSCLQVVSASVFKLKGEILPLLSQIWNTLGNKIEALLSSSPQTITINHSVIELKRQTMALLIALFSSNIADSVLPLCHEPFLSTTLKTLQEPDFALKRSALSVFTRLLALPVSDSVSQLLFTVVIPNCFQNLQSIHRDYCLEANHQAFIAEFCNLLSTLARHDHFSQMTVRLVRSSAGQLATLSEETIRDQRQLKALFVSMLENQ